MRRHGNTDLLRFLHDRADERRRELLVDLEAVHPAREKPARRVARRVLGRDRFADPRAVARQRAVDQRAAGEDAGLARVGGATRAPKREDAVEVGADIADRRHAVTEERLVHPLVVVDVHVDEAGNDPLPAGVDPSGVRGKAPRPRGGDGDERAVPDDDDAIGQRRATRPVDHGAADDDERRGGLPGRGAGHGEQRERSDGEAAQSERHHGQLGRRPGC